MVKILELQKVLVEMMAYGSIQDAMAWLKKGNDKQSNSIDWVKKMPQKLFERLSTKRVPSHKAILAQSDCCGIPLRHAYLGCRVRLASI